MPRVTNQNQLFPKGNFITNSSVKTFSTKCLPLNKHKFTMTHSMSQAHIRRAIHRHDRYLTLLVRSVFLPPDAAGVNLSQALQTEPIRFGQQSTPPQARSRRKWSGGRCPSNKAATRWWTPLKPGSGSMLELQTPSWIQMKKGQTSNCHCLFFSSFFLIQKHHLGRHTCSCMYVPILI